MNVFYCTSLKLFHIKIQPSRYLLDVRISDSFMNAGLGRNFICVCIYAYPHLFAKKNLRMKQS